MDKDWTVNNQITYINASSEKTVDSTRGFVMTPALEEHCNEVGRVQAGYLLKLIDIAGTMPVFRLVDGAHEFVTASLDRTSFVDRIKAWEYIILDARITKVFNTSVEVQVCVYALDYRAAELEKRRIATAHLIYVGLKNGKKTTVPPVKLNELAELYREKQAALRRKNRFAESKQTPFYPIQDDDNDHVTHYQQPMTQRETNAQGNVFGGMILKIIGRVGNRAAKKHALDATVVGASIDRMNFIEPAFVGETIYAKAIVTQTWNTSMETQVEVYAENPNLPGQLRKIATSTVVYVRLNESTETPGPVPQWQPQTEIQQKRQEQANLRREIRLKEKAQASAVKKEDVSASTKLKFKLSRIKQRLTKCWIVLTE